MSDFVNKVILFPYYAVLSLRNNAYDKGHRKVTDFSQYGSRVISIGNIAAGGTGKTPHVEMFIRHFLAQNKSVAVVSRGYKRKGKDELEVTTASSAAEVGDEPLQMKKKFPKVSDDGYFKIIGLGDKVVYSVLDVSKVKTTNAMEVLGKMFGKNITTRNWNTLLKIA